MFAMVTHPRSAFAVPGVFFSFVLRLVYWSHQWSEWGIGFLMLCSR